MSPEMDMISDLGALKRILDHGSFFEGTVHPSLVLGCGPDYVMAFLKKHPKTQAILWLHCGDAPGDVLKAFAAGATHLLTTVEGDAFVRLASLAETLGIALRQVPKTLSGAQQSCP